MLRRLIFVALMAGFVGVLARPALAGAGEPKASISKFPSGPFKTVVTHKYDRPESHTYYIKAKNKGDVEDGFILRTEDCFEEGVTAKFFKGFLAGPEITPDACTPEGHEFVLDIGQVKKFRFKVKVGADGPPPPTAGNLDIDVIAGLQISSVGAGINIVS